MLEPLSGYLMLAQALYEKPSDYAEGWNFGSIDEDAKPVSWILDKMTSHWQNASWQLDEHVQPHEARYLKLDSSKAKVYLNWQPKWRLQEALEKTIQWHQNWLKGEDMQLFSLMQIKAYQQCKQEE